MAYEGAYTGGEVARIAVNLMAHKLAPENTVCICFGGAFTKDTKQRSLVRREGIEERIDMLHTRQTNKI